MRSKTSKVILEAIKKDVLAKIANNHFGKPPSGRGRNSTGFYKKVGDYTQRQFGHRIGQGTIYQIKEKAVNHSIKRSADWEKSRKVAKENIDFFVASINTQRLKINKQPLTKNTIVRYYGTGGTYDNPNSLKEFREMHRIAYDLYTKLYK